MSEKIWLKSYESKVPTTIAYPELTLPELLEKTSAQYPHQTAVDFFGKKISYLDLQKQVWQVAQSLVRLGIKKGDRVGLILANTPHAVIAYYGVLAAGAVVVQNNPLYTEKEFEAQLNDAGVETLVVLDLIYSKIKNIRARTKLKNIIVVRVQDYLPPVLRLLYPVKAFFEKKLIALPKDPGVCSWFSFLNRSPSQKLVVKFATHDVALLQYTGGTTGISKGVILTHRNLLANTLQCRYWMHDLKEGSEVFLSVIPFFHVYGMTVCMNLGVVLGATMVLLPKFQIFDVLKTIQRTRPTVFPGVQAMYVAINNTEHVERYKIDSIRACISGAGPLLVEVANRFEQLTGGRLVEGYGLSEASPVTHCNVIYGQRKKGSIGFPLPDTEAKIMDPNTGDREMCPGEVGELVVKGPQVMQGYWNRPEETAHALRDGWLYTGDLARMDEQGYFYIAERKKDMIKTSGENVYPREVEEVLVCHPKIREVVVAGIPDPYYGEIVKAYVVLKEGEQAKAEEIRDFCKKDLAKFKIPKEVEFRSELPKNLIGKILRRVLREEEEKKKV